MNDVGSKYHKFETDLHNLTNNEDSCKICGLKRRRFANLKHPGRWVCQYFVDGKWTFDFVNCKEK